MNTSEEIKVIADEDIKKDFYLSIPKRLLLLYRRLNPTKVRFRRIKPTAEYCYFPRKFTFLSGTFLTLEELKAIVKKLEELNKKDVK